MLNFQHIHQTLQTQHGKARLKWHFGSRRLFMNRLEDSMYLAVYNAEKGKGGEEAILRLTATAPVGEQVTPGSELPAAEESTVVVVMDLRTIESWRGVLRRFLFLFEHNAAFVEHLRSGLPSSSGTRFEPGGEKEDRQMEPAWIMPCRQTNLPVGSVWWLLLV